VLADWEARYKTAHATLGTSGPFFLGTEPSVADLAILPFLVRFNILLQVGGSCFTAGQLTHRMLLPWQGPRCPFLSLSPLCTSKYPPWLPYPRRTMLSWVSCRHLLVTVDPTFCTAPLLPLDAFIFQVYRGAEPLLSEASTPLLFAMLQAFKARPSFALTTPTPEFIAASYYDYLGGTFPPTA
jgi:hypothetical protein